MLTENGTNTSISNIIIYIGRAKGCNGRAPDRVCVGVNPAFVAKRPLQDHYNRITNNYKRYLNYHNYRMVTIITRGYK